MAARVAPLLSGRALFTSDRLVSKGKATNEIDPFVAGAIDMAKLAPAYHKPSEKAATTGRTAGLRAYFAPVTGAAEVGKHDVAVNMFNYMDTLFEARVVTTEGHPAKGQLGLFARDDIPVDTVLGIYGGLITSSALADVEHRARGDCVRSPLDKARPCKYYIWKCGINAPSVAQLTDGVTGAEFNKLSYARDGSLVPKANGLEVLGTHFGNTLRFVNAYQGVAKHDNIIVMTLWWKNAPRIVYMTRYPIKKDAELLVNYGKEFTFEQTGVNVKALIAAAEPEESTIEAVLNHRPRTKGVTPREFLVHWSDGTKVWTPVASLMDVDMTTPADPYVFNDKFYAYLKANAISEKLFHLRDAGSITETDDEHEGDRASAPGLLAVVAAAEAEAEADSAEKTVLSIDDKHFLGPDLGYEFHVHWADKTTSWEKTEALVDHDPTGKGEHIYNEALIRYLTRMGITEYAAIVQKAIVPVRIMSHEYGKVTSRVSPPTIHFEVEQSSGATARVSLRSLVDIVVDTDGNKTLVYKPILAAYDKSKRADSEFQLFLRLRARTFLDNGVTI